MLWISSGSDTALAEEVAQHTGLKATFAAADTEEWKKRDSRRCRVIVLELPASSVFVQEVMAAAHELREKFQQTKKALQEELEAKLATVRTHS